LEAVVVFPADMGALTSSVALGSIFVSGPNRASERIVDLASGFKGDGPTPTIRGILATLRGLVFGEFSGPRGLKVIPPLGRFLFPGRGLAGDARTAPWFSGLLEVSAEVLEDATRFNASMNGVLVFGCAFGRAEFVDVFVLEGRVVAGSLCKMCEMLAVPLRVADLVKYRLRCGTSGSAAAVPACISAVSSSDMLVLSVSVLTS
jgi:hypothetical protein